jgi:6-phosphogluconolactonase (cycloisomerase 2 family)
VEPHGFLYTVGTSCGDIAAFAINETTGALTPAPGSPFKSPGAWFLAYDESGTSAFLYALNIAVNFYITAFSVNTTTGELTQVGIPSAAGATSAGGSYGACG